MFKGAGVRSVLLNTLLFISLSISHHLGGGAFVLTPQTIFVIAISTFIFWIKPIKEFEGPSLAALLITFQLIGHLSSPVSSNPSEMRMLFSHVVAVIATYGLAKNFDAVVCVFKNAIAYFFESPFFSSAIILETVQLYSFDFSKQANRSFYLEQQFGRAPPQFSRAELLFISQ